MTENDATSRPNVTGDFVKRSPYSGRIGSTIPHPTRSMATLVQMVPKPGGSGGRSGRERLTGAVDRRGCTSSNRNPGAGRRVVWAKRKVVQPSLDVDRSGVGRGDEMLTDAVLVDRVI